MQAEPLTLQNATWVADPNRPVQLSASGVVGSATYQLINGTGTVNSSTGVYTPSLKAESAIVRVIDQMGRSKDATITVIPTWLWTNGSVRSVVFDGLGGMYVGGEFTQIGKSYPAPKISALDVTTGIPVATCDFRTGFDGTISAIAISGTSIFVGGSFTQYRGVSVGYLAKLNLQCELDTTFTQSANGFDGWVYALAVSGNSLYSGGAFTKYRNSFNNGQYCGKYDLTTGNPD